MKIKICTLLLCAIFSASLRAQAPEGVIVKTTTAPDVDGVVDAVWASANSYNIDLPYRSDVPSLGASGETTWKALWTDEGIYILIQVTDDVFMPGYAGTEPTHPWDYDKPEIYFDVNALLKDGLGGKFFQGHFQIAPDFIDGKIDGTPATAADGVINAFLVTDPNYVAEYFVPFAKLLDKDGVEVSKSATIGFDITLDDGDTEAPLRKRAVWANVGAINESHENMDDCGTVTLGGAAAPVLATSITVSSAGDATTITTEGGTLQMNAAILPVNASVSTVTWIVTPGTGRASISSTGLLTARVNGTVLVSAIAQDASGLSADKQITISGQVISKFDVSIIKEGDFPTEGSIGGAWSFWTGNGGTGYVANGVCTMIPGAAAEQWQLQVNQTNWIAYNDSSYIFSFDAWADADRVFAIDFEDPNNAYERFGATTDAEALLGRSEWVVPVTTTPKTFVFHVTFDKIKANTKFLLNIMPSAAASPVYIDNISLVSVSDMAMVSTVSAKPVSVNKLKIYPNPVVDVLNVSLSSANSKVTIYNSLGSKIDEVLVKETNKVIFNVSSYERGIYFIKINNEAVLKFVK